MDLKKRLKRFFTLSRKVDGGFTLVELIVVIAVMAILGGVAVPAYSGYVTKANKQADISLASDVAHALTLAYYNQKLPNGGSVVITKDGATGSDEYVDEALAAAFGSVDSVGGLKYDKWGNGVAVAQEVVDYFMTVDEDSPLYDIFNGNADISYTDNIPELFDLMEDTAIAIAGKRESLGSGANMVTNAATITNSMAIPSGYTGTAATPAEYFSELWASSAWDSTYLMSGTGAVYGDDTSSYTETQLTNAIANAAVLKARNVALATYLKDLGYEGAYDAIANYSYKDDSGNATVVPDDAAAIFLGEGDLQDLGLTSYFDSIGEEETGKIISAVEDYYGINGDPLSSQAYTDGLAYYAMMSTVDNLKDSENLDKTDDNTWWNDLYSAVDMYSAVANGSVDLGNLNNLYSGVTAGDNSVVIMLTANNGTPYIIISPVSANP